MVFEILFLIGRILVGSYYIMSGVNHFTKRNMMVGYARSKGAPFPGFTVPLTGLMLLLGGISFLLGFYPYIGIILILLFLVPTTFIMHRFWSVPEDQKMHEMVNFMKNIALIGSTLMFLAISTPWAYSI